MAIMIMEKKDLGRKMERAYQILKEYFGYKEFRDGQKNMIQALLAGQDALGIMPTGAGKSLCFQIPALLFPGITLVVSPLISLMNDQVRALIQSGVAAAYLNRSLTERQYLKALQNARAGKYKIIYVSPERLTTEGFQAFAQAAEISMVAVDEAHCVSQWGQDFRPSYLQVPDFIRSLPQRPVVSAFTATATQTVKEDIIRILELQSPVETATGFDRKNLYYEVQHPADKQTALLNLVRRYEDTSGIVYCSTRKKVEEVCDLLQRNGHLATRYHAGLSEEERRQNQEDFLFDRQTVMVATNAFGMGIDKSNVHYVIHYNMPKDMESYYQEAGRAGRDGQPANCILLYHGQDVVTNQFLIEHAQENEQLDEETYRQVQRKERERLRKITFYCHTQDCLRKYILAYFGEHHTGFCGNCYNCGDHFERTDITVDAQIILSCVKRTGERFGLSIIVDVLRGAKNEKIFRLGLDKQSTYESAAADAGAAPAGQRALFDRKAVFECQRRGLSCVIFGRRFQAGVAGQRAGLAADEKGNPKRAGFQTEGNGGGQPRAVSKASGAARRAGSQTKRAGLCGVHRRLATGNVPEPAQNRRGFFEDSRCGAKKVGEVWRSLLAGDPGVSDGRLNGILNLFFIKKKN